MAVDGVSFTGQVDLAKQAQMVGQTGDRTGGAEATQAAAPSDNVQTMSLEKKAKELVKFNISRLDTMEKTGQLPPTLPYEQADENLMTVFQYLKTSPEAKDTMVADPGTGKQISMGDVIGQDLAVAKDLSKKKPDVPTPVFLAWVIGQDNRIPPPFSLSAVDYTRSLQEKLAQPEK